MSVKMFCDYNPTNVEKDIRTYFEMINWDMWELVDIKTTDGESHGSHRYTALVIIRNKLRN